MLRDRRLPALEVRLAMQDSYDLDLAKKTINLDDVSVIEFARKKKSLNLFADKNITV